MNLSEPADVVMPRTTAAVLRVLAGADAAFSIRQAARLAGVSAARALEIVDHAHERGLVLVEQAGRARMCRLNRDHLAAEAIVALVTLRRRMFDVLEQELASWDVAPVHATLFGSAARGDGTATSDLDILVIREDNAPESPWAEQLYRSGWRLRTVTGNPVSWFDLSVGELRQAADNEEPVLADWKSEGVLLAGRPLDDVLGRRRRRPAG
ncbi:MAG: nucleotidyltransferase domain-containing protein [Actinomycetes bacterium]